MSSLMTNRSSSFHFPWNGHRKSMTWTMCKTGWLSWNAGVVERNLARKVCVAMVLGDTKPCVAVYYKCFDDAEDTMKPVLSLLAPQSWKNTDLPLQELEDLFEGILCIGADDFEYEKLKVQKLFFLDENFKIHISVVATGVNVKDFILNFSVEKRARARNELSDALFWFVIICCCGRKSDNVFSGLKDQLVGYHETDYPVGFRRTICGAIYDCAIL